MTIDLILCGGTIDKTYFPEREEFGFDKTHIQTMIEQARIPNVTFNVKALMLKDSLDMESSDRDRVARAASESLSDKILIVHGTSTMVETAQKVFKEVQGNKTVVFFGAMVPYEIKNSDALFNFGMAVGAVQAEDPGVYISMSGKVWSWDEVEKNHETAHFVAIEKNL